MIKTQAYTKKYNVISSGTQFYEFDTIIDDEKIEERLAEICTDFSEGSSDKKEFIYNKKGVIKILWELKRDIYNNQVKKVIQLKAPEKTNFPKKLSNLLDKNNFIKQP